MNAGTGERWRVRAGWALTVLVVVLFTLDAGLKLVLERHVIETMTQIGYPTSTIRPIGIICLFCTLLYAIPRTAVLGAVLLTGFLGGAVASKVRIEDPLLGSTLFGVYCGILVWGALYLRDPRIRTFLLGRP